MRSLYVLLLTLYPALCLADSYWDMDIISKDSSPTIQLQADSNIVKTVSRATVQKWIDARDKIASHSGTYTKLFLSDNRELNAGATKAGGVNTVAVNFSMYDMIGDDDDQIAALMGHEITHLSRNHGSQKAVVNFWFSLLGGIAGAALDAKLQGNRGYYQGIGQDIADIGTGLASNAFSRAEEREADEFGFKWMTQAGYDPQGAIRLHEGLLQHSGDTVSFLSTHPSSSERIATIRKYIAQLQDSSRKMRAAGPKSYEANDDHLEPKVGITGQVGVALTIKPRHHYLIFAGTKQEPLPEGLKVAIVTKSGKKTTARIARAIDGYYSAVIEGAVDNINIGDSIVVGES